MNKRLIALSLVVTLFAAQTANAKTVGNLKPKCLRQYFDDASIGTIDQDCQNKIIKTLKNWFKNLDDNVLKNMVEQFSANVKKTDKNLFTTSYKHQNLLATIYDISGIKGANSPVYSEIALTDNGYQKQYFLTPKNQNSQPFYVVSTKAPWGSWLGLGYVNKQSRGRYWRNKAIGAAVATGAAIGGYYGIKHAGGFENKEQVYEGAKKFANDFYEKSKGWVAGFFTKREEQNIHDIEQKVDKEKNEINKNDNELNKIAEQKDSVITNPDLSEAEKNKELEKLDKKESILTKAQQRLNDSVNNLENKISNIYNRALERKDKNKTLASEETTTPPTAQVPGETRLGRKTEKVTTQKAPQTLYKNKEELFESQANLQNRETKQVKRLHKRSQQMEDIGGYSGNIRVGRGVKSAHKGYKAQRDQRAQQEKEEYNKRIKSYRPYKNLEEYQDRLRQREVDQRMTPWYKRLFNNDQE